MLLQATKTGYRLSFVNPVIDGIKDYAREQTYGIVMGILEGLRDIIVDLSFSIALIGGGLAIIMHVAGWEKGRRWAGILTVCYVLIKYLLG